MISFTNGEIFLSLGYAAGYGVAYSGLYSLLLLLRAVLYSGADIAAAMLGFEKILPAPSFKTHIKVGKTGAVFAFFSVIIFALGLVITSYLAIDGVMRVYMLIISFAAFYLSKMTFFDLLLKIFVWVFDKILQLLCIFVRLFIKPVRLLVKRCSKTSM